MDQLQGVQLELFRKIKDKLATHLSLVHEVSELLNVSYDSAYRRIRGEKTISLEELYLLCTRFGISVDKLFRIDSETIMFERLAVEPETLSVKEWLEKVHAGIQKISASKEIMITYAAKDTPFYHFFQIPEIAAFKVFFWQKTLFRFPEYKDMKFDFGSYDRQVHEIGLSILKLLIKVPSIEIWNEDTFFIFLRQIEYYWISGYFKNKDDLQHLLEKLEAWVNHIRLQAELGFRFIYDREPQGPLNTFSLYENEVVLNDNTIHVKYDDKSMTYLTYNVASLLITTDPAFCSKIGDYMDGLTRKSILISQSADKERNRFFNKLLKQIQLFRERVEGESD